MNTWIVTSSVATAFSSGFAIWSLYKWLKAEATLKMYEDKYQYESDIQRELFMHYGNIQDLIYLKDLLPQEILNYPERLGNLCRNMCIKYKVSMNRILDVGCGVGATTFYLSKEFKEVVGMDTSSEMITACRLLHTHSQFNSPFPNEGGKHISLFSASIPKTTVKERITFWSEDACAMSYRNGTFDCVIVANTFTDLKDPRYFLEHIKEYVKTGGLLIISDAYNWKNGPEKYLDGDGDCLTLSLLKRILSPSWSLLEETDLPFCIPQCQRLAVLGNAHVSVWIRISDPQPY